MMLQMKKSYFVYAALVLLVCAGIVVGILFAVNAEDAKKQGRAGAVASNGKLCAGIGAEFMKIGGSAVDSAIGTLICEGAMVPQSMGLGGGFVGIIYNRNTKVMETINARETAPAAAFKDMYVNVSKVTGAISAGIPGEILGYWEMHQKYGNLPWKSLFEPTIKLCRSGILVSYHLQNAMKAKEPEIRAQPSISTLLLKPNGEFYKEGDVLMRQDLANTLEKIANSGPDVFYNGEIGQMFVDDLKEYGGIMTLDDLRNYQTIWENSDHITANITGGYTLYTTPLPSTGALVAFIMRVINNLTTDNVGVFWQRVIETFKHAYGQRTRLGDPNNEPVMASEILATLDRLKSEEFANGIRSLIRDNMTYNNFEYYGADFSNVDDHGTSNIVVLGTDGSAVVITSTINSYFGSKILSTRTGIIANDEMDDFSTPGIVNGYGLHASPANYVQPGKRPLSSMCPTIVLDENDDVRLLVGAAGGSKITTSVATIIMEYFLNNKTMERAIDEKRIHHQLAPMVVNIEKDTPTEITDYLSKVGHSIEVETSPTGFAAVTAIGARLPIPEPVFDKRRVGSTATVYAV